MAELVGLVVGIAAFALQIGGTIESIRALQEFTPADVANQLEQLSCRLELFREHLHFLQTLESHPAIQPAVQQAFRRFRVVEDVFHELQRQIRPGGSVRLGFSATLKLLGSRQRVGKRIKEVEDHISGMSDDIQRACLVYLSLQHFQTSGSTVIVHRIQSSLDESGESATTQESRSNTAHHSEELGDAVIRESATTTEQTAAETTPTRGVQNLISARGTRRHHCGQRHCDCLCHLTGKKSGRFWFVEYTPISVLLKKPENGRCGSSRFGLKFRLALSNYGIPFAIVAGLNITSDAIRFDLQPALRAERIVKYTSPGFETLCRLENLNISLEEAQSKFLELYHADPFLKDHRDPSGKSYIQKLLMYPWPYHSMEQLELLRMFVREFEMTLEDQDNSFLTMCAKWIGEAPHLDLLDAILECGFDPTTIHSPLWEQWPACCSSNWLSEMHTPDPFFVEYLATLVRPNLDLSGSTPLCNAVLVGSGGDVEAWISRTQRLEKSTNFLGQSPLHLAITRLDVCQLLLDAGHDLDATDKWGVTPLMYAAAMGQGQTVTLLLSRGADPAIYSHPNSRREDRRTFIHYAIARDHTDLVLDALHTIQEVHGIEAMQGFSQLATMGVISISIGLYLNFRPRTPFMLELIKNLADVDMHVYDGDKGVNGNNLMHYTVSVEEASALVQRGFNKFNSPNSDGKLAINQLARLSDPALIKFCIDNGSSVRNKDKEGRAILFDLFSMSGFPVGQRMQQRLVAVSLCIEAGADIFETDDCRCSCSPDGCTISSVFSVQFSWGADGLQPSPGLLWTPEWVMLVEEHCGAEAARRVLLLLLRRVKCKESDIDITHTCCHRGRGIPGYRSFYGGRPRPLTDEDIAEIQEEESEFIEVLEAEMDKLASESLHDLWSKWILVIKAEYDAHVVETNKTKAEYESPLLPMPPDNFRVDHKNDTYHVGRPTHLSPSPYPITNKLASYAFWLQYEHTNPDISLGEVRPTGWFDRRVSRLRGLIKVMGLSAEEVSAEMRRVHKQELERGAVDAGCKMDLDFLI